MVSLTAMSITSNLGTGIGGTTVHGFVLNGVTISGNGDSDVSDESGINITGLTGTNAGLRPTAIINSTISNNHEFEVQITNSSGTLGNFMVTGTSISSNGVSGVHGNLFNFLALGTANMTLTVSGGTYTGNAAAGCGPANQCTATAIHADASGGTMSADISGVTAIDNNVGVSVSVALDGNLDFDVHDNPSVTMNRSHGLNLFVGASTTGTVTGSFRNNVVGTAGVAGSGSTIGVGIRIQNEGSTATSPVTALVSGNTVRELTNFAGVNVNMGIAAQAATKPSEVTITGNTISDADNNRAIVVQQNNTTAPGTSCANISGNSLSNIAGNIGDGTRIRLRQLAGGTFNVTQASVADLASVNGSTVAEMSIGGTVSFGQPACVVP